MSDLINSALGLISGGGSIPASSYVIHDFRDDNELLAEWGAICRRSYRWQSSWGDWHEVYSAKHPTAEAANAEARKMALSSGYAAPRWWQFWRIGEVALP